MLIRFKHFSALSVLALVTFTASPAQALDIKQAQIDGCVEAAQKYQMADKSTASKLCSCTVNVRGKMTLEQMWQIESYARSKKDPSTLPFAKKMQNDLQQCAKGLKLNPPKQPK